MERGEQPKLYGKKGYRAGDGPWDFRDKCRKSMEKVRDRENSLQRTTMKNMVEGALRDPLDGENDWRWAYRLCLDAFAALSGENPENTLWEAEEALHDILEENMEHFSETEPERLLVIDAASDILSIRKDAPLKMLAVFYSLLEKLEAYEECRAFYGEEALGRILENALGYWPEKTLKKLMEQQLSDREPYLKVFRMKLEELGQFLEEETPETEAEGKERSGKTLEERELEEDLEEEEDFFGSIPETEDGEEQEEPEEADSRFDGKEAAPEKRRERRGFRRTGLSIFLGGLVLAAACLLCLMAGRQWQQREEQSQSQELAAANEELRREIEELKGKNEELEKENQELKTANLELSAQEQPEEGSDENDGGEEQNGGNEQEGGEGTEHQLQTSYHFRAEPDSGSESYQVLPEGTVVIILEDAEGGWVKAEYNGTTGYIFCGSELEQ